MDIKDIYPLTIVSDRYGGSYSGGKYLAMNVDPDCFPDEIGGCDTTEMNFWDIDDNSFLVGKGETIMKAVESLRDLLIADRTSRDNNK